ncbi:restriction endonuclease subunit S [Thiofilum flexile]|uniref:restriction endonuclease subunit S n=1 Tax=Thiofilum flexile TaxID=125627 RepID=UPI00035D9888|nr:restriction endonuclease subunit S [Thiofilum flexile]
MEKTPDYQRVVVINQSSHWKSAKLGDVAYLAGRIGWKGLTAKEYTDAGPLFLSVHSLNYGDYVDCRDAFHISQARYDESPEIMLQKNDVLICKDGAGIGKVGIVKDLPALATINSSLLLIRSGDAVNAKYLYYVLLSPYFQRIVQSRLEGATTPHLYQRDIKEFPIHYPPLPEQKRIVAILDEAFAGISQAVANAEKNLANARELFDSYLNEVLTRKEEGWGQEILSNICTVKDGTHDSPKYVQQGIPFITQKNIKDDGLNFDDVRLISASDHNNFYRRSDVAKGDILISMIGVNRGMPCLVDDDRVFSIKNVGLIKSSDSINMNFLLFYLKSSLARKYVEISSNGGAQPFIGLTKLRSFPILIAPKPAQNKIVDTLNAIQGEIRVLESIYQRKLTALVELKQTILQKAFTGELTADWVEKEVAT